MHFDELNPEVEAAEILHINGDMAKCHDLLARQFGVIQSRSQLLLTLATVTLTITGFSGPKIAASSAFSKYAMTLGILLVLVSLLVLLLGSLRIHWTTQFRGESPAATLVSIIRYRNSKTYLFKFELGFLVAGLSAYVASVLVFFLCGA